LLYVSDQQVNAVVPYGVDKTTSAQVVVQYLGRVSSPNTVDVAPSAPGIFSETQNGLRNASVLNQDMSINSPTNPAAPGSIISVFCTGEGQTAPPGIDGSIGSPPDPPVPLLKVSAEIGGIEAQTTYTGAAPGFVAGSLQVNVRVPVAVSSGSVPIRIKVGEVWSQPSVNISVR
jgi:uncharacterized protein (TIGR03437 family)